MTYGEIGTLRIACHKIPKNKFQYVFVNTLRLIQNGRHFADGVFKCIFLNETVWILLKISLKFVPKGPINNIPSLVQVMTWRRPGDKPLSEPMMVSLLKHICVAGPQWVKWVNSVLSCSMYKVLRKKSWVCCSLIGLPSNLSYKSHLSRQWNCWSLRCSWSIACQCCSNYIFILHLTHGFSGFGKGNCKMRREIFKFLDLIHPILEIWR